MQPFNYSNSYDDFLEKLRKSLQDQNISENVLSLLKNGFEKSLYEQDIILSRKDRVRAYHTVSKEILAELMSQFDMS